MLMVTDEKDLINSFLALISRAYISVKNGGAVAQIFFIMVWMELWIKQSNV